jgi:hypothetical protein
MLMQHLEGGRLRRGGGVPHINWKHPLAQGLLVCEIDLGGRYVELARNYKIHTGTIRNPRGVSPYGIATKWPGSAGAGTSIGNDLEVGTTLVATGGAQSTDPESQITIAGNLAVAAAHAGFSFASAFYCTDVTQAGHIFGRPAVAQEAAPYANWMLQLRGTDTSPGIGFNVNNGGTNVYVNGTAGGSSTTNNVPCSNNTYTSVAATAFNTSSGSATCIQYQQGKAVNTSTGIALAASNPYPGQDPECQLMIGAIFHEGTSQAYIIFPGYVYYGYVWTRALTPAEILLLHYSPYCFLLWPEDEIADAIVGTGGVAYILNEATGTFSLSGSNLTPPVARYMKRTATILGQA